jgi:hypothetical protein
MNMAASFAIAWMVLGVAPVVAVVEGDDPAFGGEAVDDAGVPVVEDRGEMGHEDQWDAGRRAELPVGEVHATGGDGARGRVLVRRDRAVPCFVVASHDCLPSW